MSDSILTINDVAAYLKVNERTICRSAASEKRQWKAPSAIRCCSLQYTISGKNYSKLRVVCVITQKTGNYA